LTAPPPPAEQSIPIDSEFSLNKVTFAGVISAFGAEVRAKLAAL